METIKHYFVPADKIGRVLCYMKPYDYKTKNKLIGNQLPDNKAKLDFYGEIYSIKELSELLNISYSKLYYKLTRQGVGRDLTRIDLSNFDNNFQTEILKALTGKFIYLNGEKL
jgi:hypothetical protein